MIENYQNHILGPTEIIDYGSEMKVGYRPEHLQYEPMIGLKVLLKDLNCRISTQSERFQYIENVLNSSGILRNTGCVIRETMYTEFPDGFWLITFPVPATQLMTQLMNLLKVMQFLASQLGIVSTDICEVNVSGRCATNELESRLSMINLGPYAQALIEPNGTPYKLGHIIRINDYFIMMRTIWDFSRLTPIMGRPSNRVSELTIIPQLLTAAFH